MANATAVLDAVRASGQVSDDEFPQVVGRISFFVNAGIRFVTEIAKLRAMTHLWDELCRTRYGVTDPKLRRFRYGVQVNSLGLTESQPEKNVPRIVLEALAVTLSRVARARAIQLPAWNEALGLPRPWDQQWSIRLQQILAFETDLLEYDDVFAGSQVVEAKTAEIAEAAWAELEQVLGRGGSLEAIGGLRMYTLGFEIATPQGVVSYDDRLFEPLIGLKFTIRYRFGPKSIQGLAHFGPAFFSFFQRDFDEHGVLPICYRLHNRVPNAFGAECLTNRFV